eukprot:7809197-Pyramimonas_sp.AAC.1
MLADIRTAAGKRGLGLHPGKAKSLPSTTRETGCPRKQSIHIGDMRIDVVPQDCHVKYSGQKGSSDCPRKTELDNRISAAWKRFMAQCSIPTDRR